MVNAKIIKYAKAIENFTTVLVITIILVSLLHAVVIYLQQYRRGIIANINSSIHAMEGISLALSYLVATGLLKLLYLDNYHGIILVVVLILVKKLVTHFLNADVEYAHQKREVLMEFP
jgi:hypothetical protein